MKRKHISQKQSKKLFRRSGAMMNTKNLPRVSRGGIRF